jgi:mRNA-degrading endonuclease RelE of RelBE toxin-antitoxin system
MPVAITYKETARAQFLSLERKVQRKFADALSLIARDPLHPPYWLDVEPIRGMTRGWRLSLEGYRATYRVERRKLVVLDLQLGHEVYRKWGVPEV